jgi:hypothetical protein
MDEKVEIAGETSRKVGEEKGKGTYGKASKR